MSNDKIQSLLIVAFEDHIHQIAKTMIGGGEGARVRQVLERVSFSDFEAGWQAFRGALVIELPREVDREYYNDESMANGYNDGVEDCREIIEALGIKVKYK